MYLPNAYLSYFLVPKEGASAHASYATRYIQYASARYRFREFAEVNSVIVLDFISGLLWKLVISLSIQPSRC